MSWSRLRKAVIREVRNVIDLHTPLTPPAEVQEAERALKLARRQATRRFFRLTPMDHIHIWSNAFRKHRHGLMSWKQGAQAENTLEQSTSPQSASSTDNDERGRRAAAESGARAGRAFGEVADEVTSPESVKWLQSRGLLLRSALRQFISGFKQGKLDDQQNNEDLEPDPPPSSPEGSRPPPKKPPSSDA